ncbi:MAG: hypothetical protein WCH39_04060 [Schlesneria sp.]|jgi:hypothetical protein
MFFADTELGCHGFIVFGKSVFFREVIELRSQGRVEESGEALPLPKVAIIAPRDEHRLKTK